MSRTGGGALNPYVRPVLIGLAAGIVGAFLPDIAAVVVLIVGALAAGWVLPTEPVKAAALFVLPAVAAGAVRIVIENETSVLPALLVGTITALIVVAIFTHIGAGMALRRTPS